MTHDPGERTDARPAQGGVRAGVDGLIGEIDAVLSEYCIDSRPVLAHQASLASVRSSPAALRPAVASPEIDPRSRVAMRRPSQESVLSSMSDGPRRRPLPAVPRTQPRKPRPSLPNTPRVPSDSAPLEHPGARRAMTELPPAYDVRDTPPPPPASSSSEPAIVNMALLSQLAQLLACCVERAVHIKRSVSYPRSFTGRELIAAVEEIVRQYIKHSPQLSPAAGVYEQWLWSLAMRLARSLKMQLYFHEVDWVDQELTDGVDDVYMFFFECAAGTKALEVAPDGCALPLPAPLFSSTPLGPVLSPVAAAAVASAPMYALPTGVLVPLTTCYSPSCGVGGKGTCYSSSCPRSGRAQGVNDTASSRSHSEPCERAWAESVPSYVLETLPRSEVKRQNAIQEFIQKEEAFYRDLLLLYEYVELLRADRRAPLKGAALESFITQVFFNFGELAQHIGAFVEQLHVRQREESPVVQHIGDVVLAAALEWGHVYTAYVQHYPLAVDRLKRMAAANPLFAQWVDECRRHPRAQRHPLDNYLFRAPARLQRYHLHLESVLKDTDPANDDGPQIELALEVIDEQCKVAQAGVEASEQILQMQAFARDLEERHAVTVAQYALCAPERKLLRHGALFRRPDSFEFDWTELVGLLYDNCFILARRKRNGQLAMQKDPIAIDFLEIGRFDEPPLLLSQRRTSSHMGAEMHPFLVRHSEGFGELHLVYADSAAERAAWQIAFQRAITANAARRSAHAVFTPHVIASGGLWSRDEVSCAATFHVRGERLVAVGGSEGLWIGLYGQPETLRKVLHLHNVSQCALLNEYARFVVLADHTLYSYSLESLVPSGPRAPQLGPLKLSGHRDVHSFSIGSLNGRTVLAYSKRKSSEMSVRLLHAVDRVQMEPATEHVQRRLQHRPSTSGATEFAGFSLFTVRRC